MHFRSLLALLSLVLATPASAQTAIPGGSLPAATMPLIGQEVFPVAQNRATRRASVNSIPAGVSPSVATALGNVVNTSGGMVTSPVALGGIAPAYFDAAASGLVGDGTTINNTAFSALVTAAQNGGEVVFPCGVFKMTAAQTLNLAAGASVTIRGGGANCTELRFSGLTSGSGLTVNYGNKYSAFHLRDLSYTVDTNATATTGVSLIGAAGDLDPASHENSDFSNIVFRGADGYFVTDHWCVDVYTFLVSNVSFHSVSFWGGSPSSTAHVGAYLNGQNSTNCAGGPCYAVGFVFDGNCLFEGFAHGVQIGQVAQGIVVNSASFNAQTFSGSIGVYVPTGQYGNDDIAVISSNINVGNGGSGIGIYSGYSAQILGNLFVITQPNVSGVTAALNDFQIAGNHFEGISTPMGSAGVHVVSGGTHGVITGNTYSYLTVGNALESGSSDTRLSGNSYNNVTTNNTDAGTNNSIDQWIAATPTIVVNGGTRTSISFSGLNYKIDHVNKEMCFNFYAVVAWSTVPSSLTVTLPANAIPTGISAISGGNTATGVAFNGTIFRSTFVFKPVSGAFASASGQYIAGSTCMQVQ